MVALASAASMGVEGVQAGAGWMTQQQIAGFMGYLSIACWLCAQLPQVVKNARLGSCEGLALPFLVNWLFGDITNLIGCILTEQLPFQTYLATYFCLIDFALVLQFFHYKPSTPTEIPASAYTPYTSYTSAGYTPSQSLHASLILPPRTASRPGNSRTRTSSTPVTNVKDVRDLSGLSPVVPPVAKLPTSPRAAHAHTSHTDHSHPHAPSGGSDTTARPRIKRQNTTHGSSSTLNSPGPVLYTDGSYAAIYEAALDVARTAERVSARRSQSRSRRRRVSRQTTAGTITRMTSEEDVPEAMTDSFHSEMSGRSGRSGRSSVTHESGEEDDEGWRRMAESTPALLGSRDEDRRRDGVRGADGRGRTLMRSIGGGSSTTPPDGETDDLATPLATAHTLAHYTGQAHGHGPLSQAEVDAIAQRRREKSRSLSLARGSSGRGGRRAAGVAFMSLGLVLRGWYGMDLTGTPVWALPQTAASVSPLTLGRVISPSQTGLILDRKLRHPPIHAASASAGRGGSNIPGRAGEDGLDSVYVWFEGPGHDHDDNDNDHHHHTPLPDHSQSFQRQIGRVSAWACTTLYLTSRLPQIWKNFTRKSVEGLSILLFLFAFCGNLAYVFSILLNPSGGSDPSEEAGHYLLEALPYLLGSGGTLIFDLTIMVQSYFYGSDKPIGVGVGKFGKFGAAKKLRLPGRRKHRHVEDSGGVPGLSSASVERERERERAPLLPQQQQQQQQHTLGSPVDSRGRSKSPDVRR